MRSPDEAKRIARRGPHTGIAPAPGPLARKVVARRWRAPRSGAAPRGSVEAGAAHGALGVA